MALMRRQSLIKFDAPLCETIVDTPKPQGKEVLVRSERYSPGSAAANATTVSMATRISALSSAF
jgi:hypothetical protein